MAINRALPTRNADGTSVVQPTRTGSYLEAYVVPLGAKQTAFADEGSYFTAYNVTDGTGIAGHAAPVQANLSLKPLLHAYNAHASKFLYPDFLRLRMTAIGAGATTTDFTVWVDNNSGTVKSSGGTVATTVSTLGGGSADSTTIVSFGAVVATAGTGEVRVDHQRVRSTVAVVEDQYIFNFGSSGYGPATGGITMAGSGVIAAYVHCPPVAVPPGGNFKVSQWAASQSGAHSFEYTFGYVLR